MKRWMHVLVLLAFVVSTVPGLAVAMPADHQMTSQKALEQTGNHHNQHHHASAGMKIHHSCCDDKQPADIQNKYGNEECCDAGCQCMMNSCAKTQAMHHSSSIAFAAAGKEFMFIASNEHHDDSVIYLPGHPPKV